MSGDLPNVRPLRAVANDIDEGDLDVVAEHLDTMRGMLTEARAEAAHCTETGIRQVRAHLDQLDVDLTEAQTVVERVKHT